MMWLTWRQHRIEAFGAALVVIPTLLVIVGLAIAAQPLTAQVNQSCTSGISDACGLSLQAFADRFQTLHFILHATLLGLPLLPGLFIGAPLLAREFEQGTDQLVWSQGITRRRWLFVKLGLLIAVTLGIAACLAVAGQLWAAAQPSMTINQWNEFDYQGPAYVSYAFFALALGVAAGTAIGRTVLAMAATLVGFVGVRMAIALLARPNFLPPLLWDIGAGPSFPDQIWTIGEQRHLDLQGHAVGEAQWQAVLNACSQAQGTLESCLRDHGVLVVQAYQPADRFWLFQSIEATIFSLLGIVLLGLTVWLVGRRA
jgi:hypothetical protein